MSARIEITFEDKILGDPILLDVPCNINSPFFEYSLKKEIHLTKKVQPFAQLLTKINDYSYKLKQKIRDPLLLKPLTVYGHNFDEYNVMISPNDNVMDLKFLLSPLNATKAEYIEFNFNTVRRLNDNENVINAGCLDSKIRIMWWIEEPNPNKNESPVYKTVPQLLTINPLYPDYGTIIRKACKTHNDKTTFGVRKFLDKNDFKKRGEYEFITYADVERKFTNIGAGLMKLGMIPQKSMIGICSSNRREFLYIDYACAIHSLISVPLYPTLDANAIDYIVNHAKISIVFCEHDKLNDILKVKKKYPFLKYIVLMDEQLPDQLYAEKYPNKFDYTLSKFEEMGSKCVKHYPDNLPKLNDGSIFTIMYTSGTTGPPKGVVLTHTNLASLVYALAFLDLAEKYGVERGIHLSYLPLPHIMERLINLVNLQRGSLIGFWCNDRETLIEDDTLNELNKYIKYNINNNNNDNNTISILNINKNILGHIMGFLSFNDVVSCEKTCLYLGYISRIPRCLSKLSLFKVIKAPNDHFRFSSIKRLRILYQKPGKDDTMSNDVINFIHKICGNIIHISDERRTDTLGYDISKFKSLTYIEYLVPLIARTKLASILPQIKCMTNLGGIDHDIAIPILKPLQIKIMQIGYCDYQQSIWDFIFLLEITTKIKDCLERLKFSWSIMHKFLDYLKTSHIQLQFNNLETLYVYDYCFKDCSSINDLRNALLCPTLNRIIIRDQDGKKVRNKFETLKKWTNMDIKNIKLIKLLWVELNRDAILSVLKDIINAKKGSNKAFVFMLVYQMPLRMGFRENIIQFWNNLTNKEKKITIFIQSMDYQTTEILSYQNKEFLKDNMYTNANDDDILQICGLT